MYKAISNFPEKIKPNCNALQTWETVEIKFVLELCDLQK